ncbi:beta-hydroxyacyl-ACP dehydratase [Arachidicoccus ginsenosidivorans]|jgi:3-hydroxyacyl-[acyl-carrier-protein] dehydratase|uniref:Hydroxymyristoyl-ACP dehydratase n=1 Tax=Arachidicoccus ginsenosidivorans TaxID=496057 RepID=A0A5B8VJS0_9BACT|nr:hypothetical protein [Arachidicoccus ginsenosidivorans]QEC71271.1 hypothetical protein FSB73_05850 [Arachidicoccus ginsenosidivorans]
MKVTKELIIEHFPCKSPYCFINEIIEVNADHILASYLFKQNEFFFAGHFPGNPVVPGAILQEAAAQIGLLAFGMYLLGNGIEVLSDLPVELPAALLTMKLPDVAALEKKMNNIFYLTSANMDYKYFVKPNDKIFVYAEKVFFRLNKLKCKVRIENQDKVLISKGIMSGVVIKAK